MKRKKSNNMKTKPLDFISLFEPKSGRTSSLGSYGNHHENCLCITGGLSHGAMVEPNSVHDADKLIAWLQDWKKDQK